MNEPVLAPPHSWFVEALTRSVRTGPETFESFQSFLITWTDLQNHQSQH